MKDWIKAIFLGVFQVMLFIIVPTIFLGLMAGFMYLFIIYTLIPIKEYMPTILLSILSILVFIIVLLSIVDAHDRMKNN